MATIDRYKIKIEVDGKEKVIDAQKEVENLTDKIKTAGAVGAAALTALTLSAVNMADQLSDLAGVAGMTTGKIYQMAVAAEVAGGDFDQVGNMLLKFSNSVEGAVDGNDKLLQSFQQIGIGRKELESLTDEQLFNAVVSGLGDMSDGALKTALSMELLGKKAATMDLKKFAEEISKAGDPSIERALENAAKAVGSVKTAYRNLQIAALEAFEPVLKIIGEFELSLGGAETAIKILSAGIAGIFAASTIAGIGAVIKMIVGLTAAIRTAATAQALFVALVNPVAVVAGIAAAGAAYYSLGALIDDDIDKANELNNALSDTGQRTPVGSTTPIRDVQASKMEQLGAAEIRNTNELVRTLKQVNDLRQRSIDLLGQDEDSVKLILANAQARVDTDNKIAELQEQIVAETLKGADANLQVITELKKQQGLYEDNVAQVMSLNAAETNRVNLLQRQEDALKAYLQTQQMLMDIELKRDALNRSIEESNGTNFSDTLEMSQEQIRFLNEKGQLEAQIEAAQENRQFRRAKQLRDELAIVTNNHNQTMQFLRDEEAARMDSLNSEKQGVISAMDQLQQQFTPFQMAQNATLAAWNNIGSAIEDVAKGGKASFKDMARNIIGDIGAMIAKALVFKAIQSAMGIGGISLPGLATGGPANAGQPYIVGEKGPELFVPKSAGTVIPNNKLNSGTGTPSAAPAAPSNVVNNYNNYNISAVDAKSVAQLFYENRKTMLGTMNMAQKEMPYSMG